MLELLALAENMTQQYAPRVMMVRPAHFGFNAQTAVDNHYQQQLEGVSARQVQQLAATEFDRMVDNMRQHEIDVIVVDDTPDPIKTDAVFPNNWISFHADGGVVLYPMCAPIRRLERRPDVLDLLSQEGLALGRINDLSHFEQQQRYLEGTGAIVFDHPSKLAYMARSPRADEGLLDELCQQLGYQAIAFDARQTVAGERRAIYHTNVMMSVADRYAVVCVDAIDQPSERELVIDRLVSSGKTLIAISEAQTEQFAGNVLQVGNRQGDPALVMSSAAYSAFTSDQRATLSEFNPIVHSPIPTIETLGGGSARCMVAEVFLPKT